MKNLLPHNWDRRPQFPDPPLWLAVIGMTVVMIGMGVMNLLTGFVIRWIFQ